MKEEEESKLIAKDPQKSYKRLFKKHSACHLTYRLFRFHRMFFHYTEFDLDDEQTKIADIDRLKE